MVNLSWLAEIVFFGSYFLNYITDKAPSHPMWYAVSAWAAFVIAIMLAFYNGYPYVNRRTPQA